MDMHQHFECCTDEECVSGLRNNYFRGKKLTPNSYKVEQKYHLERRKLLNRAIHGWGVVYGFPVKKADSRRIEIGAGFALDQPGRELIQVAPTTLTVDQLIPLDDEGKRVKLGGQHRWDDRGVAWAKAHGGCWLLSVHYAERPVAHVDLQDPCSCAREEWDQVCETVRFSLRPIDCAECCKPYECTLDCKCGWGPCCDDKRSVLPRGGCRCLCDHLTRLDVNPECEPFCWIEEPCARLRVDLHNGVPLACVKLQYIECEWTLTEIYDDCGPRRLVKRNDLLFDLIQGCDLTRIEDVGWRRWHRSQMSFERFEQSFGSEVRRDFSMTAIYWVVFSRPVRENTVRPDSFAMTVILSEQQGGWGTMLRVPIVDVFTWPGRHSPLGHIEFAVLVVDGDWVEHKIRGRQTQFTHCAEIAVEIRVRGDYIIDCNGQRIDGSVPGLEAVPTGRVKSGGDLFSSFTVAPPDSHPHRPYDERPRFEGAQP